MEIELLCWFALVLPHSRSKCLELRAVKGSMALMAKSPKFKPQRSSESKLPWRVNVPAQHSESGKRERFYFATQNDAKTFSEKQKIRIENQGTAPHLLSAGQREARAPTTVFNCTIVWRY